MSVFPKEEIKFVGANRLLKDLKPGESTIVLTKRQSDMQAAILTLKKQKVLPETAEFTQTRVIMVNPKTCESHMALIMTRVS